MFRQTGQALQDMNPDSEETARLVEEHDALVDEEDEGFSELSADPTVLDMVVSSGTSSMLSEAGDTSNETMVSNSNLLLLCTSCMFTYFIKSKASVRWFLRF
ncbi:hypothetical protein XENOCAPTIV_022296 [Xenoophorus captivus]|uniref:Uncharacterized protein n=1 Tax=Xenoophorus captivus TaxID=1517983 RepID=A0ABV0RA51_9TELE